MSMWPETADQIRWRYVYGFKLIETGEIIYVGSTYTKNFALNHRNWKEKYGESGRTAWRTFLSEVLDKDGKADEIVKPIILYRAKCTRKEIETVEGEKIRELDPVHNVDKDPVASSIKNKRYK